MKRTRNEAIIELLWESLARDPDDDDRRKTGWGTKSQQGLIACIERVVAMPESPAPETNCPH